MTEKLKYRVGDKVLVEAEVMSLLEGDECPYRIYVNGFYHWMDREFVEQNDLNLPPKPKIPQAVMDWYENCEDTYSYITYIADYFDYAPTEIKQWLSKSTRNEHALATLIAYGPEAVEVEKEKRYKVTLKSNGQILIKVRLARDEVSYDFMYSDVPEPYYTKQELIDAGFEGVFDNEMFEVEEVE